MYDGLWTKLSASSYLMMMDDLADCSTELHPNLRKVVIHYMHGTFSIADRMMIASSSVVEHYKARFERRGVQFMLVKA
jgi:hypothetical protein